MAEPIFTVIDDGTPIDVGPGDGAGRVRRAREGGRPVALDEAERGADLGVCAGGRGGGEGAGAVRRAREGGRPVALDDPDRVAYLGVSAGERARRLDSLEAPDFTL